MIKQRTFTVHDNQGTGFEEIYQDYLARVAGLDLTEKQYLLGIRVDGQTVFIPFFNETYTVTPRDISDHRGSRPLIPFVSFCVSTCC